MWQNVMMSHRTQKPLTQSSMVLECFAQLEVESVGRCELEAIRSALTATFGDAAPSPATIARILADQGVRLRHPEILDNDSDWREGHLSALTRPDFATIDDAFATIDEIQTLARTVDPHGLTRLRQLVTKIQQEMELVADSPVCAREMKEIASEVALWLRIWLQNPTIFDDWISLRRNTPEFLSKFA